MTSFAIPEAEPIEPDTEPKPWQLWLGRRDGALVGVLADPAVMLPGHSPDTDSARRMHHIGSLQNALSDDRLEPITRLEPRAVVDTVFVETVEAAYDHVTVVLDGVSVSADALTYRGLDFAFGRDLVRHPFLLLKEAGDGRWPDIVSTRATSSE